MYKMFELKQLGEISFLTFETKMKFQSFHVVESYYNRW